MKMRFKDKHVVVTGSSQGIGFEIARLFSYEGARVSIVARHEDKLQEAAEKIRIYGNDVYTFVVDVSNRKGVFEVVESAENIAPIDVLINNAGTSTPECHFVRMTEEDWRKILDINLTGMFFMSQAVCRYMIKRRRGAIVNMSSIAGELSEFGYINYNVSKAGIIMLTKSMAIEMAHLGIRVNAVCPGRIVTPLIERLEDTAVNQAFVDRFVPMNRAGKVEDVSPAFLFLASDEACFITGQIIVVDGGQCAGMHPSERMLRDHAFD